MLYNYTVQNWTKLLEMGMNFVKLFLLIVHTLYGIGSEVRGRNEMDVICSDYYVMD